MRCLYVVWTITKCLLMGDVRLRDLSISRGLTVSQIYLMSLNFRSCELQRHRKNSLNQNLTSRKSGQLKMSWLVKSYVSLTRCGPVSQKVNLEPHSDPTRLKHTIVDSESTFNYLLCHSAFLKIIIKVYMQYTYNHSCLY